jgi:hypothetical protein
MELETKKIIDNIYIVRRLRAVLFFHIIIPLPLLAASIFIEYIITNYTRVLKLNSEILFYPLCIVVGAAVLSTPFLLYVLVKEKRGSWIIAFIVMFVLPCLLAFLIAKDHIFSIPWMIVLMVPFYFYCYLLKHSIDEWIEEFEGQEMRKEWKRDKVRQQKAEERWM